MKLNIQAVLFDLDGTLLNTLEDLADSMNAVLRDKGFPTHPTERYKYFVGDGIETLARRSIPREEESPRIIKRVVDGMLQEYEKKWDKNTTLYEGVEQLLDTLSQKGILLTVLSNKPDQFTQKAAKKFLSKWRFSNVSGAKPTVPKKPDPTGALNIARMLKIPCQNFFYLGDTDTDIKTARSSGMHPVGVLWGFRDKNELRDAGAQTIIKHPLELLDHIA